MVFQNKCEKRRYLSKSEAKKYMKIINKQQDVYKIQNVYWCEGCSAFHLTSNNKVKARKATFYISKMKN